MQQTRKKFKPYHIVLIILIFTLSGVLYLYKDKIIPDLNEPYREQYSTYIRTSAVIVSKNVEPGRRGSKTISTIQFYDAEGGLHTSKLEDNGLERNDKGDTIKIYYDPQNPDVNVQSEKGYKEIMKLK